MSTTEGKPRGYFEFILAMDCETTGVAVNCDDASYDPVTKKEYQAISWGMVVADAQTLKPVEKLYLEVQWNGVSEWDPRAEAIHGLSKEHLQKHGLTEVEAVEAIGSLIMKYWGPTISIRTLGHNVATFDLCFLKRLFRRHGIELAFGSRHVDTSTIGFVNWNVFNSDDLFDIVGLQKRGKHNSLEDALMSLETARITRMLFERCIDGQV